MSLKPIVTPFLIAAALVVSPLAAADDDHDEEFLKVTVTNLTRGQTFTPILVVAHNPRARLFTAGAPASEELATLAEDGNVAPLAAALKRLKAVKGVADSGGLLMPGETTTIKVKAHGARRVSLAAMLIPTNDAFVSLNSVRAPRHGSITYTAVAYDAGSEPNDEDCANIPGPVCGGVGASPEAGGEGFVHVHAGIHGIGSLDPAERDWRNPVARITVRRIHD